MSNDKTHNGWTNYETWAVKLRMDENYDYWTEQAEEAFNNSGCKSTTLSQSEEARFNLADVMKEEHENAVEEKEITGFMADLLNAALSEVAWDEIADAFLDGVEGRDGEKYETIEKATA